MEDVKIGFGVAKLCFDKNIKFAENFPFDYSCYTFDGFIGDTDCCLISERIQTNIPTQSLLQKFLREKYDIHIIVVSSNIEGYNYGIQKEKGFLGVSPNIFPYET
jgi:hypothetical protein